MLLVEAGAVAWILVPRGQCKGPGSRVHPLPDHSNQSQHACTENPRRVLPSLEPQRPCQGARAAPPGREAAKSKPTMGACLRKPPSAPVVIEPEDTPATALAPDDLTKPPNALHVRIIRARDLPAVDTNLLSKNSSDPYVLLECCGERARTTTKKRQLNPD